MIARDRYERWLASEIESLLEKGFRQIVTLLLTQYADMTPFQQARRARLFTQITRHLAQSYGSAEKFMSAEMRSFVGIEAKATTAHLRNLVADSPTAEVTLQNLTRAEIRAIAEFPIAGLGIGEWFEKQATDMNSKIRGRIQLGLLNGDTSQKIAGTILTTNSESPAVMKAARNATRALVRTTVTTVQTQATYETLQSIGPKYVPAYRYVAVRDQRTTPICRALDGRVFRFDDPKAKRPPQHVNCRSTIVAEPNYAALGIAKPDSVKGGLSFGSYTGWLNTQSADAQDSILGSAGGALFRSGKATLAGLVESDGRRMTRKALESLYGAAA
jgi:SPP1 gp7 family putative phage head morphogenesis protein